MSNLGKDYQIIFSYLRSLNFHYLDDWVIQCVSYCKSADPNITMKELQATVKEQWLLVNLKSMKVPALPPDLVNIHKTVLSGKYVVQVETMIDCSKSYFSQFQALLNVNLENLEATSEVKDWDIKSSRCLIFTISDGVQELKAMEYHPIKKIRMNDPELLPGFKMLIIGPVECRKGMILLKEENVEIYGGEVDTLIATNSLKSILIQKLNLNEEDYPEMKCMLNIDNVNNSNADNIENVEQKFLSLDTHHPANIETLLSQNDDLFLQVPLEPELLIQRCPSTTINSFNYLDQQFNGETKKATNNQESSKILYHADSPRAQNFNPDHMFDDIISTVFKKHDLSQEEKALPVAKKVCEATERKNILSAKQVTSTSGSTSIISDHKVFSEGPLNFSRRIMKTTFGNSSTMISQDQIKQPIQTVIPQFFGSSNSLLNNSLLNNQSTSSIINNKPLRVGGKPFVYLKQISVQNLHDPCIFTIKGTILTLKNKIKIENDQYSLLATITDGSLSIDARFSSDIIENLLEYSPCEIQDMMKNKKFNSAVENRLKEAFSKSQQKFISLNCLMKIKFFPQNDTPLILSLEEVNIEHLKALKERMIL